MIKDLLRALRLPFIVAGVIPFVFGSLIERCNFNLPAFIFGLFAVSCTHLSANLINDYSDAESGVDAIDARFFGFFGGSKLIQEGVLSGRSYFAMAVLFGFIALFSVISLAFLLNGAAVLAYFTAIILLSWAYSVKPLQLAYRGLGEIVVFILFGPVPLMGGYYIQSGIFPDIRSFMLSLPFGFLTAAILLANEAPDVSEDRRAGKRTWAVLAGGKNVFILYSVLTVLGFASVFLNISIGYLGIKALPAIFFIVPALKAAGILRRDYRNKEKMIVSSRLAIGTQAFAGISLVISLLI
ncbi:MAG: prenyltransferase [Candidatus Omnitrophota bacterium]|jgi:1,4-dihydroxy-2-naphthoate octaprenyltransferase